MGTMITRKHRELSDQEIAKICAAYHNWRDGKAEYEDALGFCKSASVEEVRQHEYILTPGRYVGIENGEDDGEPFDQKMTRLTAELAEMFVKSHKLEDEIKERLGAIGYEF
jgi:type I restriction enzyme M protein